MELFVERGTMRILGGMGSNVYPTVDAGIYAMTNQIVAAVMKVSSGKATVTRLQMNRPPIKRRSYVKVVVPQISRLHIMFIMLNLQQMLSMGDIDGFC